MLLQRIDWVSTAIGERVAWATSVRSANAERVQIAKDDPTATDFIITSIEFPTKINEIAAWLSINLCEKQERAR